MLLKKSSCVLYSCVCRLSCVCYHCVGMYPAYICIFLHELEDEYIYVCNKKCYLAFANEHVLWSQEKWQTVHFSDEFKFLLIGSDRKTYVRRKVGVLYNCGGIFLYYRFSFYISCLSV